MKYSIVVGTNRVNSNSEKIANYYKNEMSNLFQTDCELINLQHLPKTFSFDHIFGNKMLEFNPIQQKVTQTNKFIFIIPEYNGSFPGILKSFIDCCSFPESFAYKKCALVGVSAGKFGNVRGLEHFSGISNYLKMNVLHNKIFISGVNDSFNIQENDFYKKLIYNQIQEFISF